MVLRDIEKNWSPFVHRDTLYFSYTLQPHAVLRCDWVGGGCVLAHNTTSEFLQTYASLQQDLRGGSPYVTLPGGGLLAAMHVKDASHVPSLYGTIFYLLEAFDDNLPEERLIKSAFP